MSIAPCRTPVAAGEYTVLVARGQNTANRWLDGAARVADFSLEFAGTDEASDRGIASEPPNGLGGNHAAALDLASGRAVGLCQGVGACLDHEHDTRRGAVGRCAARALPAQVDERVGSTLSGGTVVILVGQHAGIEGIAHDGAALGVEQSIEANEPIHRFADMEIASLAGAVRLCKRRFSVDPMLKSSRLVTPGWSLARVHGLGGFEKRA